MNVNVGDLAILVHPKYPENKDRICTIIERLENVGVRKEGIWWLCNFPSGVKTELFDKYGMVPCSATEDWRLRKITGPNIDIGIVKDLTNDHIACKPLSLKGYGIIY